MGHGVALSVAGHNRSTRRANQQKGMGHQLRDGDRRLGLTKSPISMTLRHSVTQGRNNPLVLAAHFYCTDAPAAPLSRVVSRRAG